MKNRLYILFFLLSVGQAFGQTSFTISGYGKKLQEGDTLYLSYVEKGNHILESTTAVNQRFSFTGVVKHPTKANIYRNENPEVVEFTTESVSIYLEPGDIKIISPDTLTGAEISGTPLNDTLQLLHRQLATVWKRMKSIKDPDLFDETEKKDTALLQHNKRELDKAYYEGADVQLAFANQYPNSYVSLDILHQLSRINTYIFKVEKVYNKLAESLKNTEKGKTISERIKKKSQVMAGMKAIDFSMENTDGKIIRLFEFEGKYLLLDFWASWCGPCREEHTNLINAYQHYRDRGFAILSVSIDTDKNKWKEHHKAYVSRGSAYFDLKDYPSAINDYSKAIHIDPKNAEVYTYRGRTYYECDSIELALADYNKAIQLKDKLAIAYYQRGLLRFTNKDLAGGCQDFKKAADLGDEESAETVKKYCNEFL